MPTISDWRKLIDKWQEQSLTQLFDVLWNSMVVAGNAESSKDEAKSRFHKSYNILAETADYLRDLKGK